MWHQAVYFKEERIMNLKEYFSRTKGTGFLATSSADGKVDLAVYSRPHVMEDGTIAFIMRERLTHENLQQNTNAAYAFIEEGGSFQGIRLFIRKTGQDENEDLIAKMSRRNLSASEDAARGPKHIVYFKVEKILSLVGGQELDHEC